MSTSTLEAPATSTLPDGLVPALTAFKNLTTKVLMDPRTNQFVCNEPVDGVMCGERGDSFAAIGTHHRRRVHPGASTKAQETAEKFTGRDAAGTITAMRAGLDQLEASVDKAVEPWKKRALAAERELKRIRSVFNSASK